MLSKIEKTQMIADRFAHRFLCTVITEEALQDFHLCVELAHLDYMEVITYMYKYQVDWSDDVGRWVVISPLGGVVTC